MCHTPRWKQWLLREHVKHMMTLHTQAGTQCGLIVADNKCTTMHLSKLQPSWILSVVTIQFTIGCVLLVIHWNWDPVSNGFQDMHLSIYGAWPWHFRFTWHHRACYHLIPHVPFPIDAALNLICISWYFWDNWPQTYWDHDLDYQSHVTSSITWPFYFHSPQSISYWWSSGTEPVHYWEFVMVEERYSCHGTEIFSYCGRLFIYPQNNASSQRLTCLWHRQPATVTPRVIAHSGPRCYHSAAGEGARLMHSWRHF